MMLLVATPTMAQDCTAIQRACAWLRGLQPNATELALQRYEDLWVDASSPAAK